MPSHRIARKVGHLLFLPSWSVSISIGWRGRIHPTQNLQRSIFHAAQIKTSEIQMRTQSQTRARPPTGRLKSMPSWERATQLSTAWQTQNLIPTADVSSVRTTFCGHNIEFSCPAASAAPIGIYRLHDLFQAAFEGTTATICYAARLFNISHNDRTRIVFALFFPAVETFLQLQISSVSLWQLQSSFDKVLPLGHQRLCHSCQGKRAQ